MSTQKQSQHYSFSALAAGSSRRRRLMLNSLVAERLDIEIADIHLEEETPGQTEQQPTREQVDVIINHSEFDDWISTIKTDSIHSDLDSLTTKQSQTESQQPVLTPDSDNIDELFNKLECLTEAVTEHPLPTVNDINDSKNTNNEDQFEIMLAQMPQIADVVKSFDSPQVQRDVFHALMDALKQEELLKTEKNPTEAISPRD